MNIWQIFGLALLICILLMIGKDGKISPLVALAGSIIFFIFIIERYSGIVSYIKNIADAESLSGEISFILKIAAIAIATHLCAITCRDFGENALAEKIELCAKAEMLMLSLPMIKTVVSIL